MFSLRSPLKLCFFLSPFILISPSLPRLFNFLSVFLSACHPVILSFIYLYVFFPHGLLLFCPFLLFFHPVLHSSCPHLFSQAAYFIFYFFFSPSQDETACQMSVLWEPCFLLEFWSVSVQSSILLALICPYTHISSLLLCVKNRIE